MLSENVEKLTPAPQLGEADAAALAEQPAKKAKAPGDAAAAATDAAAAAEAKRQKRLASRKAFREKRKRQRKERIQQLLASRPACAATCICHSDYPPDWR